ncbi:putative mRNA (guanine-N(7)-)-methyltransferase [Helianthus anomalus]
MRDQTSHICYHFFGVLREYCALNERKHGFQAKSQRTYDKSRLPPGWLDCPTYGKEIGGIVPSKVSLVRLTMTVLYLLGMVTDLANTTHYYSVNDWKKEGIKYVKVSQFLARQKNSKKYVLVHYTHGHNRTCYLSIHYLMRTLPIYVTQALRIFFEARPLGIYKPDYINVLYAFYHERKPDMVTCPPTPEWKRSS